MITLGRNICLDLSEALTHEWLVTNGLGGYAAGTLPGVNTRRYHGLLFAALKPPVERTQMVANCDEEVELDNSTYLLGANEYQDERINPGGFVHMESFKLDHGIPSFLYRVGPAFLEKTVWMEYGRNTTYIRYRVVESPYPLTLTLRPFVNYRDHHKLTKGNLDWNFAVTAQPIGGGCTIKAFKDAQPYYLLATPRAAFTPSGVWYWNFRYRTEQERGLDYLEDLYLPGVFRAQLTAGQSLTLIATAEQPSQVDRNADAALARARSRQERILRQAGVLATADADNAADANADTSGQAFLAQLVQAADQFLVLRSSGAAGEAIVPAVAAAEVVRPVVYNRAPNAPPAGRPPTISAAAAPRPASPPASAGEDAGPRTVIAGYPWFTDWGRDTMIALPGLTIATGRLSAAEGILRTFSRYVDQGMVPNLFPDEGAAPEYNTADATLWYFHAIAAYLEAGGDLQLAYDFWPQLEDIIRWHVRGTRYGIGVDSADGLLRAGAPGAQVTWMDVKIGDHVVTPRYGKPVEIQALWYHALRIMARLETRLRARRGLPAEERSAVSEPAAAGVGAGEVPEDDASVVIPAPLPASPSPALDYAAMADQARDSFRARFWYAQGGYLYDVVDGPDAPADASLRPNQLFALSLEPDLVDAEQARSVLGAVRRELLTPVGLRTLAPSDPHFLSTYTGPPAQRDLAYHQGVIWIWLMGAYGDAIRRWEGADQAAIRRLLAPLQRQLAVDCAGSLNEIFDSSPPFRPKGAFAQAWSVSEVLRLLREE